MIFVIGSFFFSYCQYGKDDKVCDNPSTKYNQSSEIQVYYRDYQIKIEREKKEKKKERGGNHRDPMI